MPFRLVVVDGPLKGHSFRLTADGITIGRDLSNMIGLPDASVSRQHCVLTCAPSGEARITDRNSRNGTFVNGLPVRDRALAHGDEIRIGASTFVLLNEDVEQTAPAGPALTDWAVDVTATLEPPAGDSVYVDPAAALGAAPAPARAVTTAATLLRVSGLIAARRGIDELADSVVALALHAIPAARGAVLLYERWSPEPVGSYARDRGGHVGIEVPVARRLADRVLRDGVAALARSPEDTSVLAAPLRGRDRIIGLLYLECSDPHAALDREHLQLAAAIGVLAGAALENARYLEWLSAENERLECETGLAGDMVGESAAMREVQRFIARAAPSDATVLISGESGTGKELVARALHRRSRRSRKPFLAINCAALTETLLETELFGHEKGAFTGAVAQKRGKLEVADGGTVFLDEVGELPLGLQAKVLRAIQEREFERVGGTASLQVDIRLIGATNRDLKAAVAEEKFREDLYYRINVVSIEIPPLRERREDIPLLVNYFVSKLARTAARTVAGVSPEALACMLAYDWPGNVRELQNAIEHAVVLGATELILPEDLPESLLDAAPESASASDSYREALLREKKDRILRAMEQARGSYPDAARLLGLHPNYLHRLVTNLRLRDTLKALYGKPGPRL